MALTKAQTLTFAGSLCLDLDNSTTISQYFDDAVDELGKLASPPFTDTATQSLTSGTATYSYAAAALRLLYSLYTDDSGGNSIALSPCSESDIQTYSEDWAADSDDPVAFTNDNVTARQYTLYPSPVDSSDSVRNVYSEDRSTDIEDYYALPIAFDCLARDFLYPSAHQDLEYSAVCGQLASFLYQLAGVTK